MKKKPTSQKTIWRKVKYPGIFMDAQILQVSRYHLYMVLEGKRESKILMQRYCELKERQRQEDETFANQKRKEIA